MDYLDNLSTFESLSPRRFGPDDDPMPEEVILRQTQLAMAVVCSLLDESEVFIHAGNPTAAAARRREARCVADVFRSPDVSPSDLERTREMIVPVCRVAWLP